MDRELRKRRIRYDESRDIVRWGYQPKGAFTTYEADKIICNSFAPQDPIWSKIWCSGSWPKISHFLWLVGHQRILTWDKLRRRNFHGPSIYFNCNAHEETLQHLLDSCPLANQLWEKASFRCQRRCKLENKITNSIRQWQRDPYKSEILNHLWRLVPELVLWSIWKERNKRIFKNQCSSIDNIWNLLCKNLQETLMLRSWKEEDWPTLDNEKTIMKNWQIHLTQGSHKQDHSETSTQN